MTATSLPSSFIRKKENILSAISTHASEDYNDKSPKGTIDSEIIELIEEINAFDGYVTTSSCAGRVAVFVEGRKGAGSLGDAAGDRPKVEGGVSFTTPVESQHQRVGSQGKRDGGPAVGDAEVVQASQLTGAGPGGKGHGNRWLYVSHTCIEPSLLTSTNSKQMHELFELIPRPPRASLSVNPDVQSKSIRLIKLSFSPLILHILCSSLQAAKPLLAAAINAGFRESGVQSLKALDDEEAGVMLAIRTAGLSFETVVGVVEGGEDGKELYRSCVDESYLRMCVGVVAERFDWNVDRRERLRRELKTLRQTREKEMTKAAAWEDKDIRRERKRQEGMRRQGKSDIGSGQLDSNRTGDVLDSGLFLDDT